MVYSKSQSTRTRPLKEGHIIPLKYDFMFTQIFNDPEYEFALDKLLADILKIREEDLRNHITYLNRNLKVLSKENMLNQVDLVVKRNISGNLIEELINIEVNSSIYMTDRNKVYTNMIGASLLKVGRHNYQNISPITQINFNFFKYNSKEFVTVGNMSNKDGKPTLGWKDKIYHIFCGNVWNIWYNINSKYEKGVALWSMLMDVDTEIAFLRGAEKIMGKKKAKKLLNRVQELSGNSENIVMYTKLSNYEMAYNTEVAVAAERRAQIIAKKKAKIMAAEMANKIADKKANEIADKKVNEAVTEKVTEKTSEIAKNMLSINIDVKDIAKTTGLSIEKIEALK